MKTCVLYWRRRNADEWTMRSRSRWNRPRYGASLSGKMRPRDCDSRAEYGAKLDSGFTFDAAGSWLMRNAWHRKSETGDRLCLQSPVSSLVYATLLLIHVVRKFLLGG